MSPARRLLELLELLPDDAQVSVRWIREQLARVPGVDEGGMAGLAAAEAGRVVGRKASTIRNWCAAGELPGAYKLNGKEWRIPSEAVRAFAARQRGTVSTDVLSLPAQNSVFGRSRRRRRRRLVASG